MVKWKMQNKYIRAGVTALIVIILSLLFSYILDNKEAVAEWKSIAKHALFPIIAGAILAYLLNPVLNAFERVMFRPLAKKIFKKNEDKQKKFSRAGAITCTIAGFLVFVVSCVYLIAPQVYQSILKLVTDVPVYYQNVNSWIRSISKENPTIGQYVIPAVDHLYSQALEYLNESILPNMDKIVAGVTSGIVGGFKILLNVVVSIIVSVYVMSEKEILISVSKKLTYSIFSCKNANAIVRGVRYANQVFGGFIIGKIIDSFIIGVICYIFMLIAGFHYSVLISIIVGVTNVIPYFGPFIGAIPSCLILLMMDYKQGLVFAVFILILQQVDGNIIGPLILGDRLKISSMWILFAILVGGGFFGIPGMILGAPCFACIYAMVSTYCKVKLQEKQLPVQTSEYFSIEQISLQDNEVLHIEPSKEVDHLEKNKKNQNLKEDEKKKK